MEASGIALALAVGFVMDKNVVFAKKSGCANMDQTVFRADLHSYTHKADFSIEVSRKFLSEGESILIVDDFLATGSAFHALLSLCEQAGAKVVGFAAAVEKCFQNGGDSLRRKGYRVESLAMVESMEDGQILFRR